MISDKTKKLLHEDKVLIACHRGCHGGNIIQNTLNSCLCAYAEHAHIAEIDVVRSIDGVYYVFHDSEEPATFGFLNNLRYLTSAQIENLRLVNKYGCLTEQKVPLFKDLLKSLKGKGLINMDRCWGEDFDYLKGALDLIYEEGMLDSVIVKSNFDQMIFDGLKNYEHKIQYMCIVSSVEQIQYLLDGDIDLFGVEILFKTDEDETLKMIPLLKEKGIIVWGNSINLNDTAVLSAGHDDITALLENKDKGWGFFIESGFDIIQTDFPASLYQYIKNEYKN